jgi:hypothetical protein
MAVQIVIDAKNRVFPHNRRRVGVRLRQSGCSGRRERRPSRRGHLRQRRRQWRRRRSRGGSRDGQFGKCQCHCFGVGDGWQRQRHTNSNLGGAGDDAEANGTATSFRSGVAMSSAHATGGNAGQGQLNPHLASEASQAATPPLPVQRFQAVPALRHRPRLQPGLWFW